MMIRETFFQDHLLVLEHIHRFRHYEAEWDVPREISNKGIREYLNCGRGKAGKICGWLVEEGWVVPKLKHIVGESKRLTTYYPTQKSKDELNESSMIDTTIPESVIAYPPKWSWNNRVRKWVWLT